MILHNTTSPPMWIIGAFAVYAATQRTARLVYDQVNTSPPSVPFGTILLDTGEEVDWVDMRFGVMPFRQFH